MIYGPGSGTSDDILLQTSLGPAWGSSGEFMVNAKATAKHRALLEMINSGVDLPRYARGGAIGGVPSRGSSSGLTGTGTGDRAEVAVFIHPSGQFEATMQRVSQNVTVQVIDDYDRNVLPGSVGRINNDPARVG